MLYYYYQKALLKKDVVQKRERTDSICEKFDNVESVGQLETVEMEIF